MNKRTFFTRCTPGGAPERRHGTCVNATTIPTTSHRAREERAAIGRVARAREGVSLHLRERDEVATRLADADLARAVERGALGQDDREAGDRGADRVERADLEVERRSQRLLREGG